MNRYQELETRTARGSSGISPIKCIAVRKTCQQLFSEQRSSTYANSGDCPDSFSQSLSDLRVRARASQGTGARETIGNRSVHDLESIDGVIKNTRDARALASLE